MSFKLKLAVYFVLLALLPLSAAFVGFSLVVQRSETRVVDARLESGLRAAVAGYRQELDRAQREASALAQSPRLQRALADRDRRELQRILAGSPRLRVEAGRAFVVGRRFPGAAERRIVVEGAPEAGRRLGVVTASVPLDGALAARLAELAGLGPDDRVVLLRDGRVAAGLAAAGRPLRLPAGRPTTVSLDGRDYRALRAQTAAGDGEFSVAVLTPRSAITEAQNRAQLRLLLALAASLILVALVAYLEGRSIVRTLSRLAEAAKRIARGNLAERVDVRGNDEFATLGRAFNEMAVDLDTRLRELERERRRLRDATVRFGQALSATHDVDQLLRAIVETAVETTGATGGAVLGREGEVVEAGTISVGGTQLELPLVAGGESYGRLVLTGPRFTHQDYEAASLLVGHAVVALENARLHRIVEQQALVDSLTGLANRRQADEALAAELARANRFGHGLALLFADLDDFKSVNDAYGHPTGDAVLREFAEVLRESIRDTDLAARWGGEEFAVILPETGAEGAIRLAERVRAALAARTMLTEAGERVRVTASFGVATHPPAVSQRELVAAADAALYEAKRTGKDRTAVTPQTVPGG